MKLKSNTYLILLLLILTGCQTEPENDPYFQEIEDWRNDRMTSLTRADGWTTLIGLYWLEEGTQTFGSSTDNDIVFPEKLPSVIGSFTLSGDSVVVNIQDTSGTTIIDMPDRKSGRIFSDIEASTSYINYESFTWYLIERGGQFGIRLKDSLAEQRLSLKEIPHFPVDEQWKFEARLIAPDSGATIPIENILGQISDDPLEGYLEFTFQGKNYQIAALNGGSKSYFLIIGDETTGEETYGGGRYMYVNRVDSTGVTVIDFNKAYNPPCVFSEFATCPLPPAENYLPFRITAGEKELPHH